MNTDVTNATENTETWEETRKWVFDNRTRREARDIWLATRPNLKAQEQLIEQLNERLGEGMKRPWPDPAALVVNVRKLRTELDSAVRTLSELTDQETTYFDEATKGMS